MLHCNTPVPQLDWDLMAVLEKNREAESPWPCTWEVVPLRYREEKNGQKAGGAKEVTERAKGKLHLHCCLVPEIYLFIITKKKTYWSLWSHTQALCSLLSEGTYLGLKHPCFPAWSLSSSQFPSLSFARQCSWRCDGRGSHVVHSHEGHQCGPAAASLLHFPSSCSHADFIL